MRRMLDLADPREWPSLATAPAGAAALYAHVDARLAAQASRSADAEDGHIDAALMHAITARDGYALAALLEAAPSAAAHRHLARRLAEVERTALRAGTLAVALFAIPVVIVAARESEGDPVELPGTLASPHAVADLLREHDALRGNVQFALSPAIAGPESLDVARLPSLIAHAHAALAGAAIEPLALCPQPVRVEGTAEGAHLRFVVGSALCGPDAEPFEAREEPWSMALARALSRALVVPGVTVLALPRPPQRLTSALASGRLAQRDVALQLFIGNALRRLRSRVGEPIVVLSAHRAPDAPGGGELRIALSSPFAPREAQGFRYPLQRYERVPDAVASIATLLADCRVADVRMVAAVLPDRDAATGVLRFGQPQEAAPADALR